MVKVTIGKDMFRILARPSQLYLSGQNHTPNDFGLFEVDMQGRPLSWLTTKKTSLYETVLVRCQEYEASKFNTAQEAQDFLNDFA